METHLQFQILSAENTVDGNYIEARILDRPAFFPADPTALYQFSGPPTFTMTDETCLGRVPVVNWVVGSPDNVRPEKRVVCTFCSRDKADVTKLQIGDIVRLEPVKLLPLNNQK
jgi:hypothetical protein